MKINIKDEKLSTHCIAQFDITAWTIKEINMQDLEEEIYVSFRIKSDDADYHKEYILSKNARISIEGE